MISALLILLSAQAAGFSVPSSCTSYATPVQSLSACSTASAFCSARLKGLVYFTSTVYATSTSTVTKDLVKNTTSIFKSFSTVTSLVTTLSTITQIDAFTSPSPTTILTTDLETSTLILVSTLTETSLTTQLSTEYTEIPSTTVYPSIVVTSGTTTIFEPTPTSSVQATTTITTTQSECPASKNRRRGAAVDNLASQASCGLTSLNAAQGSHACACYQALHPSLKTSVVSKLATTTVFKTATFSKTVLVLRTTVLTTTSYTTSTQESTDYPPTTIFLPTTEIDIVSSLSTLLDWQTSVVDLYFTSTVLGPGLISPTTTTVPSTAIVTPNAVTVTTATVTAYACTTPPVCTASPGINVIGNPGFEQTTGPNSTSSPDWTTSGTMNGAVYFPNQPAVAASGNYFADLMVSVNGGTIMLNQTLSGLDTTQYYVFNVSYNPQGLHYARHSDYCTLSAYLDNINIQRLVITSTTASYVPFLGSVLPDASVAQFSIQLTCQFKLYTSASLNIDQVGLAIPDQSCTMYIQVVATGTPLDGLYVQWQESGDGSFTFTSDLSSATLVSRYPSTNLVSIPTPGSTYGFWTWSDSFGGIVNGWDIKPIFLQRYTLLTCAIDPVDMQVSCNDGNGNTILGYTNDNGPAQLVIASANTTQRNGMAWSPIMLQAVPAS